LNYENAGEIFVYEVEPNTTHLIVPLAHAPRLDESREQCLTHNFFVVDVIVLLPDINRLVGGLAANVECPASNLPTATITP
jgi:hypothetical protein